MPFYGHANPDVLLDTSSQLMKGASVSVYLAGTTTLATIYSTRTGTVKANPFTTNAASGTYDFYAVPGNYDLSVGGSTVGTVTVWPEPNRGDSGYQVRGGGSAAADTAELQQAMNDANADGGRTVMLPKSIQLNAQLVIPHGCDIVGLGGIATASPSTILLTAAGAGLSFGTRTVASGGASSGGFLIDAQKIATLPIIAFIGTRGFKNIEIKDSAGDGIVLAGHQNAILEEINVTNSTGDNIVFDEGAGGNHFLKCESNKPGRSAVAFRATRAGGPGVEVAYPLFNVIESTYLEYVLPSTGPLLYHGAGLCNQLVSCIVSADQALTAMATRSMIQVTQDYTVSAVLQPSNFHVHECYMISNVNDLSLLGFDVRNSASLYVGGVISAIGMGYLYGASATAIIRDYSVNNFSPAPGGKRCRDATTEGVAVRRFDGLTRMYPQTTGDSAVQVYAIGEGQPRFALQGSGTLLWTDGVGPFDVDWVRKSAGVVGTDYCTRTGVGATAARPTGMPAGAQWFDTTLGKPIWWSGSNWRDAAGTVV